MRMYAISLASFLLACSTSPATPPADPAPAAQPSSQPSSQPGMAMGMRRGPGPHHGMHGGGPHGGHGGLRHIMHQLALSVMALQSAIEEGDAEVAGMRAQLIADACGGHDPSHHGLEGLGEKFAELDAQLHERAAALAAQAKAGDLAAAAKTYPELVATCTSCHAQAPRARGVRLGHLVDAPRGM